MLILVCSLLLSLFSFLTVGSCSHACYSTDPQPAEMCSQLFEKFKSALKAELNTFKLNALFYPSLDTVPSLANITYVQYYNMSPEDEPCPKSQDDTSSFINVSETNADSFGWSTTGVYDVISPIQLHILQPRLLQGLMQLIKIIDRDMYKNKNSDFDALLWVGTKPLDGVVLYLNLSLPCIPTENQVSSLLLRTTSELTTYVEAPEVCNGYAIQFNRKNHEDTYILLYMSVCATTLLIIYVVIFKLQQDEVERFLNHKNAKRVTFGMFIYDFLEFVLIILLSIMWFFQKASSVHRNVFITKLLSLAVIKFLCLLAIIYKKPTVHVSVSHFVSLNFVYFILTTMLPFVMLVFVYPMWASSFLLMITVIFAYAYIICNVVPLVTCIHCASTQTCMCTCTYHGQSPARCSRAFLEISVICFVVTVILGVYLLAFELFIINARGVASGGTVKLIIQLLPSAFLPFVGWFVRYMSKTTENHKASPEQPHAGLSLQGTQKKRHTEHTHLLQQQSI